MKKQTKTIIAFILFLSAFSILNVVYAATSSKIAFCDYSGVRRTFKILGMVINVVKVIVPLILIITGMITLSKTIISGKSDDFKGSLMILAKKFVAGFIVFLLPSVLDYAFDTLIGYDDSSFTQCSNCLLDTSHCTIPESDPETYTE